MTKPCIALIGGTGNLGTGLARRWSAAGYDVIIGSRDRDKAEAAVAGIIAGGVRGQTNRAAARAGDIIGLTNPYAHLEAMLE